MPLDYNSTLVSIFGGFVFVIAVIYFFLVQPVSRFLPRLLRLPIQAYWVRFIQMGTSLIMERVFELKIKGDTIDPRETCILICNHRGPLDFAIIWRLCRYFESDANVFFWMDKKCVRFPTLHTTAQRVRGNANWSVSPAKVDKVFDEVTSTSRDKSTWIVVFPEVNYFSPELSRVHQITCRLSGAAPLQHLLYPRFDSSIQAVDFLRRGIVTAVYDVTIEYAHKNDPYRFACPSLATVLPSKRDWLVTITVRRHDIHKVPNRRKKLEKWLEKCWYCKDKLMQLSAKRAS